VRDTHNSIARPKEQSPFPIKMAGVNSNEVSGKR
jgi:hypothetical protein